MRSTTQKTTSSHADTGGELGGVAPPGAEVDAWQHDECGQYRILYGSGRGVAGRPEIRVRPTAIQLGDGSIDNGAAIEAPGVHVDGVAGVPLSVAQARALAARLLDAVCEIEHWQAGESWPEWCEFVDRVKQRHRYLREVQQALVNSNREM